MHIDRRVTVVCRTGDGRNTVSLSCAKMECQPNVVSMLDQRRRADTPCRIHFGLALIPRWAVVDFGPALLPRFVSAVL